MDNTRTSEVLHFPVPQTGEAIRVVMISGEPWFVTSDACVVLVIAAPSSSLRFLDEDEKGLHTMHTPGGDQRISIVNEAGLYSLILRSRKPAAKVFKRWITHEVLPSIRKTGRYETAPQYVLPATFSEALRMLADETDLREKVELQLELTEQELELAEQGVEARQPFVDAFKAIVDPGNTYLVRDAAKLLSNDPHICVGERALFLRMMGKQWIYRTGGKHPVWNPYQAAVETGYVAEKLSTYTRRGGGQGTSIQVRLTVKGILKLYRELGGSGELVLPVPTDGEAPQTGSGVS